MRYVIFALFALILATLAEMLATTAVSTAVSSSCSEVTTRGTQDGKYIVVLDGNQIHKLTSFHVYNRMQLEVTYTVRYNLLGNIVDAEPGCSA